MNAAERVESLTHDLRLSDWPPWRRLRQFLERNGMDVAEAAMADMFPEDLGYFGVLVTTAGRVFTFDFAGGHRGDIRQQTNEVEIANWRERAEGEDQLPYEEAIAAARSFLRSSS
jgi:hypothetical protein